MDHTQENISPKRKPVNLTINEDILNNARLLEINVSREAEKGIKAAIKQRQEQQWLEENAEAIKAHNKRVEDKGLYLQPYWAKDD